MQTGGETAAPERYWCGKRKFPRGQAWLRGRRASPTQAVGPTANACPISREAMPRSLRRGKVATFPRWGVANESRGHRRRPPTDETALRILAVQSLPQVNLTYPADVRDSAKSGWGPVGNCRLNDLAESTRMNRRGPRREDKASSRPRPVLGVGAVIVVGGRESRPQGEGRQVMDVSPTPGTHDIPGRWGKWRTRTGRTSGG